MMHAGTVCRNGYEDRREAAAKAEQGQQRMVHKGTDENGAQMEQVGDLQPIPQQLPCHMGSSSRLM